MSASITISRSQLEAVIAKRLMKEGLRTEQAIEKAKFLMDMNLSLGGFVQKGDELSGTVIEENSDEV